MAELVGVVAGGVGIGTLAAQIASNIIKLKSFWEQIKDVPEDIQDLLEELEDLKNILADIEDDQRQNPMSSLIMNTDSSSRCLKHCRQAVNRLDELTNNLSADIEGASKLKRKWGSAKVVLRKEKIDRYKSKLQRAIRLLSLSHQVYTRTLVQLQPDIIITKLSQLAITPPTTDEASQEVSLLRAGKSAPCNRSWSSLGFFGTVQYSSGHYYKIRRRHSNEPGRREEHDEFLARYTAPPWLVNRAWSVRALSAVSGWTLSLRSYNVIARNSIIFDYIREHNVVGIQELFSLGEASPMDCDEQGLSLLHYAVLYSSLSACKLLVDQGGDVDYCGPGCYSSPTVDTVKGVPGVGHQDRLAIMRLLVRESRSLIGVELYDGPTEGFSILQQHCDPLYYQRPLAERVFTAIMLTDLAFESQPTIVQLALGDTSPSVQADSLITADGRTILHAIAGKYAAKMKYYDDLETPMMEALVIQNLQEWRKYLREILVLGPNLHRLSSQKTTPFLELLVKFAFFGSCEEDKILILLRLWLEDLQASGVNLEHYGRKEHELHEQSLSSWHLRSIIFSRGNGTRRAIWKITRFEYGPLPSDWHVVVQEQESIATQQRRIPGAWVEDENDEDSEQAQDEASNTVATS